MLDAIKRKRVNGLHDSRTIRYLNVKGKKLVVVLFFFIFCGNHFQSLAGFNGYLIGDVHFVHPNGLVIIAQSFANNTDTGFPVQAKNAIERLFILSFVIKHQGSFI